MEKSYSNSYREAGVDVTAGYRAVEMMKEHVRRTVIPGVIGGPGGFGGMFEPDFSGMAHPVLCSGTDGVGTKLKLAFLADRHNTVGIDCVAMNVNDILCCGAKPLFFLDYIAVGKNVPERVAAIVSGVAEGCVQAGCALVGGETAEMPGFYADGEYDLAGFAVGAVDKEKMLDRSKVQAGDVLIGLASSGPHSNGFSLIRRVFDLETDGRREFPELGRTLLDALLEPTRIYVRAVLPLIERGWVKSAAHITGGGFYENIPRSLPDGMDAVIRKNSYPVPPLFGMIQTKGNIPERDMYNTFNMGIGMTLTVAPENAEQALELLRGAGEQAYILGEAAPGEGTVRIC